MKPTIARIWRGRTARHRADESESEFITISYWESIPAMSRFPKSVQILRIVSSA